MRQVVVGHALWQQAFGGTREAIGRTIQLRGESFTVIGVMPPGFEYPDRAEVWVPLMARYASYQDEWWKRRDTYVHKVAARLAPGATLSQAQADVDAIAATLASEYPETNRTSRLRLHSLRDGEVGPLKPYVLLVGGAVALLLVLGCANVAGLLVARAAAQGREIALRAALGAGLTHVVRRLLAESLVYAVLGAAFGLALAVAAVHALTVLVPVELPVWMQFGIDWRVLAFTSLVSAGTAVAFSLAPLAQFLRPDLNDVLKRGGRAGGGTGGHTAPRLRRLLIVGEVALSVALLIGAGLMLRSFARLMAVDTGVRTDRLLVASVGRYLPNITREEMLVGYADEFRRMRDALAALPGVDSVGSGSEVPYLNQAELGPPIDLYTRRRARREQAYRGQARGADVMPGYFATLGIPLLQGRDFTEADTLGRQPVVIISRRAAEVLFPGEPALGQELRWGNNTDYDPWMTVVGIVDNTIWHPAERQAAVEVYWSYRQYPGPTTHFLIRTQQDPTAATAAVRRPLQSINPEFSIRAIDTMDRVASASVWQRRLWGVLLGTFAGLAVLLTAAGLFGVMSYLVAQRTREMGIRLAIGAGRASVLRLVLGQGLRLTSIGIALGLAAAAAGSGWLRSLLFEVSTLDLATFIGAPLLLFGIAAAACLLPAWRASRVDPLIALRTDAWPASGGVSG